MPRANVPLPTIPPNQQIFRATMNFTAVGQKLQTRVGYLADSPGSNVTTQAFADALLPVIKAGVLGVMCNQATWESLVVDDLHDLSEPEGIADVLGNIGAGSVAGEQMPPPVCLLTTKYTAVRSQHGRGVNFWPSPPTSFATGGQVNAVGLAALTTLREALLAGVVLNQTPFHLCVFQRSHEPVAPTVLRASAVLTMKISPDFTSRATRKVGRGK